MQHFIHTLKQVPPHTAIKDFAENSLQQPSTNLDAETHYAITTVNDAQAIKQANCIKNVTVTRLCSTLLLDIFSKCFLYISLPQNAIQTKCYAFLYQSCLLFA